MRYVWAVLVFLPILAGTSSAAGERLGECTKEMRATSIFDKHQRPSLRVLVTRFRGEVGAEAGHSLAQELPEYFRSVLGKEAMEAGLSTDDLQVAYVPCELAQHKDARLIGQAWGADLVFWGQASCGLAEHECQQIAGIVTSELKRQIAALPPAVVVKGDVVQNISPRRQES